MKWIKNFIPGIFLFLLCSNNLFAQPKPASAKEVILEATKEARALNKNIFIIFHASWCVWCHRMDSAMQDKSIRLYFENNFIIKHLDVFENKNKKNLENPGATELLTKYNGDQQGVPYWVILDKNGELLADSRIIDKRGNHGKSVGCPAQSYEVDYFIKILKETSNLSDARLDLIRKRFLKNNE